MCFICQRSTRRLPAAGRTNLQTAVKHEACHGTQESPVPPLMTSLPSCSITPRHLGAPCSRCAKAKGDRVRRRRPRRPWRGPMTFSQPLKHSSVEANELGLCQLALSHSPSGDNAARIARCYRCRNLQAPLSFHIVFMQE